MGDLSELTPYSPVLRSDLSNVAATNNLLHQSVQHIIPINSDISAKTTEQLTGRVVEFLGA